MSSFSHFGKLPLELQFRIWTFYFETPRIIPRIVKLDYDPINLSYKLISQPPTLTQICRSSRILALEKFLVLNPSVAGKVGAIYFNPTIDILFYHSSYQPGPNESPNSFAFTPSRGPNLELHHIHHLMLKQSYIRLRSDYSFLCPIAELKDFENLDTIYIELPSHAELEKKSTEWYSRLMSLSPNSEPGLPSSIRDFYARERLEEKSRSRDIVPGYISLSEDQTCMWKHQLIASLVPRVHGSRNRLVYGDKPEGTGRWVKRVGPDGEGVEKYLPATRYLRKIPVE